MLSAVSHYCPSATSAVDATNRHGLLITVGAVVSVVTSVRLHSITNTYRTQRRLRWTLSSIRLPNVHSRPATCLAASRPVSPSPTTFPRSQTSSKRRGRSSYYTRRRTRRADSDSDCVQNRRLNRQPPPSLTSVNRCQVGPAVLLQGPCVFTHRPTTPHAPSSVHAGLAFALHGLTHSATLSGSQQIYYSALPPWRCIARIRLNRGSRPIRSGF